MAEMTRTVKDSVFTYLFRQPEYTRQLYLSLHPEDTDVTEADCKLVTLQNILTTGLYNDLGIQVRNKILLLVEAQSTFSVNIALRMLLYLASTYKEYVEEQKLDLYGGSAISIPRPELYVVYTGERANVPEVLRLSDLYDGAGSAEIEVKVLRDDGTGDILDQYIRFCKITDGQRKLYGSTVRAVSETIRLCMEQNILAPFLASRQKEVSDIMVTLYDEAKVMEIHDHNVEQRGVEKGIEEGIRALVTSLNKLSFGKQAIAQELIEQFNLLPHVAEEKVQKYCGQ